MCVFKSGVINYTLNFPIHVYLIKILCFVVLTTSVSTICHKIEKHSSTHNYSKSAPIKNSKDRWLTGQEPEQER